MRYQPLKILIYTHEFPPFQGGAGTYSCDLAAGLVARGVEVHVATPCGRPGDVPDLTLGIRLHYMAEWQTRPILAHAFLLGLNWRYTYDLVMVCEHRAQMIVASMPPGCFRYVVVLHGSEVLIHFTEEGEHRTPQSHRMASLYERADACIAVSQATGCLAARSLKSRRVNLLVVQNGINLARLQPPSPEEIRRLKSAYGEESEIVFCLGRLDLDKGQDILLKAFAKVHRMFPNARLLVGGDGPEKSRLLGLRDALGLGEGVEFLGPIPQSRLAAYYDRCDVFVLTSKCEHRWEGFGLVYLEAGYFERAVVGGNEGGVPEAIADQQSGLVVNPRDENAVADALISLLSDKAGRNRMGANGKRRVLTYFNSDRMAAEIQTQTSKILSGPKPSHLMSPGLALGRWLVGEFPSAVLHWLQQKSQTHVGRFQRIWQKRQLCF